MNRNLGLDIVRSVAIVFVLLHHSGVFYSTAVPGGILGVELFFVLSGFLIGQIIIQHHIEHSNLKSTYYFWMRRWLRTLPLYFLILLIRTAYLYPHLPSWKYFVFLQNFSEIDVDWFIVAWSLSVEEWFYLVLPLLFFITGISFPPRKINLFVIALIGFIFLIRIGYVFQYNPDFSFGIKKNIPFRMDSLLIGVLLANIRLNYSRIYAVLSKPVIFFSGILLVLSVIAYFHWTSYSLEATNYYIEYSSFARIFLLPIISFSFFLIIPLLDTSVFLKNIPRTHPVSRVFYRMSIYTYGIYLVHKDVFNSIIKHAPLSFGWFLELSLAMGLTMIIVMLLYHFFEKPIMRYRDRTFTLSNMRSTRPKSPNNI